MTPLPEIVCKAWESRQGPIVLSTVSPEGVPNAIYASCVQRLDGAFVVADNFFDKTRANILSGCKGSLLFITEERKSYQVKGTFEYVTEGPVYDEMKSSLREGLPGHAAAVLHVDEAYSGAQRLE
ncbi:MAG: pyridoxamine 5'-phosphate oxidase family protein [Chloroflexi bacterium]|nr:pyridoxamine 5'-phosphate oxidase family protein [Chloroflexota bacterium]